MRKPPLISLSVKVGLVLFAVVAGALAIVYVAVVPQLEDRLVDAKIVELNAAAPERRQPAQRGSPTRSRPRTIVVAAGRGLQHAGRRPRLAHGRRRCRSSPTRAVPSRATCPPTRSRSRPSAPGVRTSGRIERDGEQFAEVALPAHSTTASCSSSARPWTTCSPTSVSCARSLLVAGAAALAISWLAGYLLAWNFTRRIRRLETAAERLADGDFETPVVDRGRDEVGQLADAFDGMRSRLAVLDRARAASSSPTPRTSCARRSSRSAASSSCSATRTWNPRCGATSSPRCGDQIDRLTRLATDLLDLSRLDAGQLEVEIEPFDLAATARLVADEFRPVAEATGHELTGRGGRRRPTRSATSCASQQIVRALVENAIRHTPAGTTAVVRVAQSEDDVVLEVRDDGPGIPAEDQEHLFQRFYRAAGGKASGSGLGLAIASELAYAWTGRSSSYRDPGTPFSR